MRSGCSNGHARPAGAGRRWVACRAGRARCLRGAYPHDRWKGYVRSGRGCSVGARNIGARSHGARRTTRSGSWSPRSCCNVREARPSRRCTNDSSSGGRRADALSRARVDSIASVIRPLGGEASEPPSRRSPRSVAERGGVPDSMDELLDLPGVGRYAASATLAVAFEQPAPVVDGVSARVYRRYFGLEASLPRHRTPLGGRSEVTPRQRVREWNWAVLDLAAAVCLPKIPRCEECPLRTRCAWS